MVRGEHQRRHLLIYQDPELETVLKDLSLERYSQLFKDEAIDFKTFLLLTEEDFKELGLKFGARRKLRMAIDEWKSEAELPRKDEKLYEFDNLKSKYAEICSKLEAVTAECVHLKENRDSIEAEQMEQRAKRNYTFFIAEKVHRACKELQTTQKAFREHINTLKTITDECKTDEIRIRLKELHKQMSEDMINTDKITETLVVRVGKICDDVTELSSGSDSPESSCTSFSRSESGQNGASGVFQEI